MKRTTLILRRKRFRAVSEQRKRTESQRPLSLDCRLRIFYLFLLCYFQTVNSKKVWIKNMESKVYESFSNFFQFSWHSPKTWLVLFSIKPCQRSNYSILGTRYEIFLKIRKNQRFESSSKKGKLLLKTAGISNIFIFTRPLIYESFLL